MKTIFFDMDGTIANLYGVENWLSKLRAFDASPYAEAEPLVNMEELSEICRELQAKGIRIGIISWLSKESTKEYNRAVRQAKREWLAKHFDIKLDEVHMVRYDYPKRKVAGKKDDVLIDDNADVCENWEGRRIPRRAIYCKDIQFVIPRELRRILTTLS